MGFLTDEELHSLRVTNMILHVVGDDGFTPEAAREVEHEQFFIDRIRDTDVAPVYSFDPASQTKAQIERIASGADEFESGSQALAREFSRLHVGTSREGALFIFELSARDPVTKIYSLIKYDYREAIEQTDNNEGNLLRRIVHAFIADKKAIQKSAIIRVVDGAADSALSARDRAKQPPEIGDYFATFLHVTRARTDQELNHKTVEVLREVLIANKGVLPHEDVARAFRHAKSILRDRQEITEEAISDAVLAAAGNPEDEATRMDLQKKTRRKIRSAKLEGLVFRPNRQILRRPPMRQVRTTEGITLIYPDEADGAVVNRNRKRDGSETITIHTRQVTEDRVVRDKAR